MEKITKAKESKSVLQESNGVNPVNELIPFRNNVVVRAITLRNTITVNNKSEDKNSIFKFIAVKCGSEVKEVKEGDEVILSGFPTHLLSLKENKRSHWDIQKLTSSLSNKEFQEFAYEIPKVCIVEYFMINEFEILGVKTRNNSVTMLLDESVKSEGIIV